MIRDIQDLGNVNDSSPIKEEDIYPKRDEIPKPDKEKLILVDKPVFVMTINTSHLSKSVNIRTSINTPKNNTRKVKSFNSVKTNIKHCYKTPILLSADNPYKKEKLGKLAVGNHRKNKF